MAEKRMLVAHADAKAWEEFRQALGESWIVVGAASCGAALAEAEKQSFDAAVANFELPEWGGPELLNRLRAANPRAARFIAADPSLKEKVMCHLVGGDQFLPLPFDRGALKNHIDRSLANDYGMSGQMRELIGRIRTFPTIPSLYLEVINALKDPNATTSDVGAIIAKDMSMTTKLVQVLNSAYFGLPRIITDPTEAVGILGFETVKSLIMAVKLLSQYDKMKPVYFSIDNVWRHSTNVARTAKIMTLVETDDADFSSVAYTAGLMHDLGRIILAANFDKDYSHAHTVSRKRQIPLWDVERDIFGVTHGEIGAYLLGLWGMADEVVRVAAHHHQPLNAGDKSFTALTAVHVANALEYEGLLEADGLPVPLIDTDYLQQLGLGEHVDLWREAQLHPEATRFETKLQRTKSAPKPAARVAPSTFSSPQNTPKPNAPAVAAPIPVPHVSRFILLESPGGSLLFRKFWKWLGVGLAVSAVLALLAWLDIARLESTREQTTTQEAVDVILTCIQ